MSTTLLTVAPSPHVHDTLSTPQVMRVVIYAMLPALALSVVNFGLYALWVTGVAIMSCLLFEHAITRYLLKKPTSSITDGSAIITGMLLAFNVPSSLPWYLVVIGAAVAVGIGKMSFGGLGNNPFNPALVGRVFLLISFPVEMTHWPATQLASVDGTSGATILGMMKEGLRAGETMPQIMASSPDYTMMFLGLQPGSIGEMSVLALVLGLIYMLYRRIITWHIPISMLAGVVVFSGIFWLIDPSQYADPMFHLLTGGVMLGAVFMATDYVTSPVTHKGMIIFGVGIALITVLIRLFGSYPEGVSFAILIMNAFVPLINQFTKPKPYGLSHGK